MSKKTKEKGIWIPKQILFNQDLDPTDKIILTKIYSLIERGNGCHAPNRYFEKYLGIQKSAISKRITKMMDSGFIKTETLYEGKKYLKRIIIKGEFDLTQPSNSDKFSMEGIWIPNDILLNHDLDPNNKFLLTLILSLTKLKNQCFATNQYFGNFLGLTEGPISKRISALQKLGYIKTRYVYKKHQNPKRFILKGEISSKPTVLADEDSFLRVEEVVAERLEGISQSTEEVFPEDREGVSQTKVINTATNSLNIKKDNSTTINSEKNENKLEVFDFPDEQKKEEIPILNRVPRKPGEETNSGHMSMAEYMRRTGRPDRLKDIYNG